MSGQGPQDRYGTTRDLARELATIRDHLSEAAAPGGISPTSGSRFLAKIWVAGALAALTLAALSI
jgi:hypothetical protein